jgi:hypothetical protein
LTRKLALPFALVALLTVLVLAQSAAAAITSSSIDSPADPTYFFWDGSSAVAFHVHGTASGSGSVDLDCFDSSGTASPLVASVPVSAGAFAADVTNSQVNFGNPCVLRAVPAGDSAHHPPGDTGDPFQGPTLFESSFSENIFGGQLNDFEYLNNGLGAVVDLHSASGGAINYTQLPAPGTLALSEPLFFGNGYFNGGSLINVDGADSFLPDSASGFTPGWEGLHYTKAFDPATGAATVTSQEPAVTCADAGCSSYVPAGIELDRTVKTSDGGHVISMTDSWRSTDGAPHALDATYAQEFHTSNAGAAFLFPGASGFQVYAQDDTIALPHGPGTVYVKEDHTTPDTGDVTDTHPQCAVSYASAPDSSAIFSFVSSNASEWDSHYVRTVPATGAVTLRFSYAQAFALSDVQALAQAAIASFSPSIAITSPVDGSHSSSPTITVTGTASDGAGIASVQVNGQNVSVGGDESWSRQMTLSPGANQVTAVATDVDGLTAQRQITVTYTPPTPPPPKPHLTVGRPHATHSGVSFRLTCASAKCSGSATLTATELVRIQSKLVGLAARTLRKAVTVGRASFSLQPGSSKTVTVRLGATGRKLLAHFKRLPVKVSITGLPAKKLTIRAKRRHRR